MRTEEYDLLHPHRRGESITIGREKGDRGYIYLSIELRERLDLYGDRDWMVVKPRGDV